MRIVKNLSNFLKDQEYYIDIFNNYLHVYSYLDLISLSSKLIELKMSDFNLIIEGENLIITEMDKQELLIKGLIINVGFKR